MQRTEGKERLVLLGPDSSVKQMVKSALERSRDVGEILCVQRTDKMEETDALPKQGSDAAAGLTQGDRVLLFGRYGVDACTADTQWVEELTEAIGQIQKIRPRAVLFLSDQMVYGKVFGAQRLLKEDEIGYVCHTSEEGMTAQWMRTAEHFCVRLAREEKLPVKIARADWEHIPVVLQTEGASATILRTILALLENGTAGEAYNISGLTADILARKNAECAKTRSPLAPVELLPDIGKAENYAAS